MNDVQYNDDDFVYVSPEEKKVIGLVEWLKPGVAKKLEMKGVVAEDDEEGSNPKRSKRKLRKRYYPWGTYRSMKRLYKLKGKEPEVENYKKFDEALHLALEDPFWD